MNLCIIVYMKNTMNDSELMELCLASRQVGARARSASYMLLGLMMSGDDNIKKRIVNLLRRCEYVSIAK